MSQPPRHRLKTNPEHAARARAFADWLESDAFLAGHPNVLCFDFFDLLADDDDQDGRLNMLRAAYEKSAKDKDSHPNTKANKAIAPVFLDFLLEAAAPVRRSRYRPETDRRTTREVEDMRRGLPETVVPRFPAGPFSCPLSHLSGASSSVNSRWNRSPSRSTVKVKVVPTLASVDEAVDGAPCRTGECR